MAGAHHRGLFPALAVLVTANANRDPDYTCPTCGDVRRPRDPWEAGHKQDGAIIYSITQLHAQHRSCNRSSGAKLGNQRRIGVATTRVW